MFPFQKHVALACYPSTSVAFSIDWIDFPLPIRSWQHIFVNFAAADLFCRHPLVAAGPAARLSLLPFCSPNTSASDSIWWLVASARHLSARCFLGYRRNSFVSWSKPPAIRRSCCRRHICFRDRMPPSSSRTSTCYPSIKWEPKRAEPVLDLDPRASIGRRSFFLPL